VTVDPTEITPTPEQTAGLVPTPAVDPKNARALRRKEFIRALLRSKTFIVGAVLVIFWVLDAIFWRAIVPHDPQAPSVNTFQAPSSAHWFGTDNLGRDVFSRVLAGASDVLVVAPLATFLGVSGGIVPADHHRGARPGLAGP